MHRNKPMQLFSLGKHGSRARAPSDDVAQHGDLAPVNTYQVLQPLFTACIFCIEHLCYGQLTPVKTRYPLTSVMWPYRGLRFRAHRGLVFFLSWPLPKHWLFDRTAGSCLINLQWSGPRVDRSMNLSSIQMFFTTFETCAPGVIMSFSLWEK